MLNAHPLGCEWIIETSDGLPQSEDRARKLISTHLDFLFDQDSDIISCAILEIWLARLSPKHRPVEVRCGLGKHENRTFLKGCTDYMILTVIRETRRRDIKSTPDEVLQQLNLGSCAYAVQLLVSSILRAHALP
jgi:hypothetical protein